MKSNNYKWSLLWNPFIRIAGWQAFFAGLIVIAVTGFVASYGNLLFDGAIDAHFGEEVLIGKIFLLLAVDLISVVLMMYLTGLFISKNFRFVDILGTMTLSRAPFLVLALSALFVRQPDLSEILKNPMIVLSYPSFILFGIISVPVIVWYIALMYNALKISTGVRGTKLTIAFILALFIAEVVSKALIYIILK